MLALEVNDISSWSDVATLSHLPNLTQLLLSSNAISTIPLNAGQQLQLSHMLPNLDQDLSLA